ncbi:MAG: hypothetical protein F6K19_05065 [Cyanothece sp. SIO1E1]|nr:hypothetical protein [Cyanothece sp. SIO1E1]
MSLQTMSDINDVDYLNYTPDKWDYELRHQIFEAFLTNPDGLELIKTGLEQLYFYGQPAAET